MEVKNGFIKFEIIDGRSSNRNKLAALVRKQLSMMDAYGKLNLVLDKDVSVNARRYKVFCNGLYMRTDITIDNDGMVIISSVNSRIKSYLETGITAMVPYWNNKENAKKIILAVIFIITILFSSVLIATTIFVAAFGMHGRTVIMSSIASILSVMFSYKLAIMNGKKWS